MTRVALLYKVLSLKPCFSWYVTRKDVGNWTWNEADSIELSANLQLTYAFDAACFDGTSIYTTNYRSFFPLCFLLSWLWLNDGKSWMVGFCYSFCCFSFLSQNEDEVSRVQRTPSDVLQASLKKKLFNALGINNWIVMW